MNRVKLSQFDIYGTFRLTMDEVAGIENLVQKLDENEFLSRNLRYYPHSNLHTNDLGCFGEICDEYECLNQLLPRDGKPGFVICEKMHELATRAVNTIQQNLKIHLFQNGNHFDTVAQKCAQECADNLVRLLHNQTAERTITNLRDEHCLSPNALLNPVIPFADNKKQLYMCAKALPADTEYLITPGRGSSKLGTLVQAVRRHQGLKPLGFTQVYYSCYKNHQFSHVFPQVPGNLPEKLLVMDDTIFYGNTLHNLKKTLTKQGHQVTNGALTASFCHSGYVFKKTDWAQYIDIIPNQYADPNPDQETLRNHLKNCYFGQTEQITALVDLLNARDHGGNRHTADYLAMRKAEKLAANFGADLYRASEKISHTGATYNQKIRDQIIQYNKL